MKVRLEFKPEDCWLGVFWRRATAILVDDLDDPEAEHRGRETRTDVWICLLPMLPIHLWWTRPLTEPTGTDKREG